MRTFPALIAIGLLSAACNKAQKPETISADAKLSQMIVGTWAIPAGVIKIDADGTSTTSISNRGGRMWFYQCDWKITNGYWVATVSNVVANSTNYEPAGSVERMKIINLDSTNLEWRQTNGTNGFNISLKRLK